MLNFKLDKDCVWDVLKSSDLPIVMYGTGNGADKVIDEFERLNIRLSGVFASDNFKTNRVFRGHTVKKLCDFENEYSDFIAVIAFASQIPEVMDNMNKLAQKHRTLIPCVPVFGNEILNQSFIKKYECELNAAYELLEDDTSKAVFEGAVNFQFSGKLEYLYKITSPKDEAFNNILKLGSNENYLDLGAYRGDTIKEFLNYSNSSYNSITALEPDKKTFLKLQAYALQMRNTTLINNGVWSENKTLNFETGGGRNTCISNKTGQSISCVKIDDIADTTAFSYIKADVEGAEYEALLGAENTLKKYKPKLNIAAYHYCEDIFKLPLLIKKINPSYKIYLRKHPYVPCWDMNLYCI